MFAHAGETVRRPGLFRTKNDADACRSFAAVESSGEDPLQIPGEAVGANRSAAIGNVAVGPNQISAGHARIVSAAKGPVRIVKNGKSVQPRDIRRRINDRVRADVFSLPSLNGRGHLHNRSDVIRLD